MLTTPFRRNFWRRRARKLYPRALGKIRIFPSSLLFFNLEMHPVRPVGLETLGKKCSGMQIRRTLYAEKILFSPLRISPA